MARQRRQEQERASSEVTEVARDVLRLQLPVMLPGLGHVNCYALVDDDGVALVDPGLPGPPTWWALGRRLAQAGLEPRHVHTVVVTHSHPDHFGGVARIVRESGARVIAHADFAFGGPPRDRAEPHGDVSVEDLEAHADALDGDDPETAEHVPEDVPEDVPEAPWTRPTPWGGEAPAPPLGLRIRAGLERAAGGIGLATPHVDRPLGHHAQIRLASREWVIHHTPGHTHDHICLHDPAERVFLSGDHVLPTITPHISGLGAGDPLRSFFASLDAAAEIPGVDCVLPAHGHPFGDLAARAGAIRAHHEERLEKLRTIGRELGAAPVHRYMQHLFRRRSWGSMAESETYAHLEHLRVLREADAYRERGLTYYVIR